MFHRSGPSSQQFRLIVLCAKFPFPRGDPIHIFQYIEHLNHRGNLLLPHKLSLPAFRHPSEQTDPVLIFQRAARLFSTAEELIYQGLTRILRMLQVHDIELRSSLRVPAIFFIAFICAFPPTLDTDIPTLIAGFIPALKRSGTR